MIIEKGKYKELLAKRANPMILYLIDRLG